MSKDKKEKSIKRKTADVCFGVVFAIIVAVLLYCAVCIFSGKTPFFFGYGFLHVKTGSMEPTIPTGSIILVKQIDGSDVADLPTGDTVVVYYSSVQGKGITVTHRMIENHADEGYVVTKGNANPVDDGKIEISRVFAYYVRTLPVMTSVSRVLRTSVGFILIIILPSVALLVSYVVAVMKDSVRIKVNGEKNKRIEYIKKQAVEEYLKSLNKEKLNDNTDNPSAADLPDDGKQN